jgi:NAD(P)-dependent dehydrogenase (short-subunit alcohol dehydrogenase family)
METIVITGSTRGIGLGIAKELLRRQRRIVINGRQDSAVQAQKAALLREFPGAQIAAFAGDVTQYDQVQQLWDFAVRSFGKVDVWINNAGVMNGHLHTWELPAGELQKVVEVNLLGPLFGCKVAIAGMMRQPGGGHVYNFEGFGSNGRQFHPYMSPYGSTKTAVRYLTKALAKETKGSAVKVGAISPGIVVTDLLRDPYVGKPTEWAKAKKIFNILGDHVETVTPYIAEQVLKQRKSGESIEWLTFGKVLRRFLGALVSKRDLFVTASAAH